MRILLLCLLPVLAWAAPEPRGWQLDVLVFERALAPPVEYDPSWAFRAPPWLPETSMHRYSDFEPMASPAPLASPPPTLSPSVLDAAARRLDASGAYRVLAQGSWRVAANASSDALPISDGIPLRLVARETLWNSAPDLEFWLSEPDLAPPVDIHRLEGRLRFAHEFHPILNVDLSYIVPLAGMQENQIDPDGRREYFRDQVQQFPMQAQRSLKTGEPAYFDHFRIGVLAQISPLSERPTVDTGATEARERGD